ncbi:putative TIM-barrel fold metal-dependent hydrolase [Kushneria sinocarnis]|uniref:Putative TIM-barrel fold metal-dependent hydrolase n=1 Tax=Kushneria sinocarnis TaxID=595502 RepID=A0A420WW86_9GAMM|nr:amidohydrolase family protein [Kushneria sinocarnis]RKR03353.1 putative TIM-barrel fold metal-dependent hydrolase [Kushneria sinocarnis]
MELIDAHVHLWSLATGLYPHFEQPPRAGMLGDARGLAGDHRLADLKREAADCTGLELAGAINIEANATDALAETQWLEAEADADDLPLALMVAVDLAAPDARAQLEAQLAASARIRGVRQILNVHADPAYDYVGRHYMREPAWRRGFALLAEYGLSFELQLYPDQMREAAELARAQPDTTLLLNHAGMWVDRTLAGWRAWRDGLRRLAACPNVAIKLSGLAMLDHRWTVESLRPQILEALDAFGSERCLFGSNFPIDGLFSDYATLMAAWQQIVAGASLDEQRALFAGNARRYYRLSA